MSFLYPIPLAIGLALVATPVLIHLINLRRQRRIRWAAMQFLLESQRRNRRWILLKQILLLATRMAVITILVLMLAHLMLRNEWMNLLGSGTTHHLVLLDDSYSMSDHWENTSALAEGKRAIRAIVDQADQRSGRQLITLLRFSEAERLSAGAQPKVFGEPINEAFRTQLEPLLASWDASQTDVSPAEALKAIPRLPLGDDEQALILYVVSDFRARQFGTATDVRKQLADLQEQDRVEQIHLVRCVSEERPNLAITSLTPESGVRAAGVEMWMSVTVANYGDAPARGVTVQLEQDGDALPALALDDIGPRDELTRKFRVQFAGTGAHALTASLGADAVDVDNRRHFACDLPAAQPVLIVDGSPDGQDGRQLSLALEPGGNTRTGWQPRIEPRSFLADLPSPDRGGVGGGAPAAICLLDVPRLADDELAALEEFVRGGGGLAIFVGPEIDRAFYNERLYRNGEGLLPAPLKLATQLMDRPDESMPDVEVVQHPLFQVLAGRRNGLLPLILIDYYYAVADEWTPSDKSVRVVARLRNNEPLVIEMQFGDGRVVAHLTKLSSGETPLGRWSNWSLNPAFPVLANELVSYLAAARHDDPLHEVGDDLVVSVDEGKYEPTIRFVLPNDQPGGAVGASRPEVPIDASPSGGQLTARFDDVAAGGIYEAKLQTLQGGLESRDFAVNVPVGEGDLALSSPADLDRQLAGIDFQLHQASEMALDSQQLAGFEMSDALFAAIVAMLIAEQLFAYMASYHVAPLRGASR
jgi:hypothetical protein